MVKIELGRKELESVLDWYDKAAHSIFELDSEDAALHEKLRSLCRDYCSTPKGGIMAQVIDDRYDQTRFGLKAVEVILAADEVKLERYSTGNGYYLYLNGSLFCSVIDKDKLTHLFELLACSL